MGTIHISMQSVFNREQTMERIDKALKSRITELDPKAVVGHGSFFGKNFTGVYTVTSDAFVMVEIKISGMANLIKGRIEKQIRAELDEVIGG